MLTIKDKVLPEADWLRKYYYDLRQTVDHCTRCSYCKYIDMWEVKDARFVKVCPSSSKYLFDCYSCQGRQDVALALLDGRIQYDDSPDLIDIFYKCDTCGGCDVACKRGKDAERLRALLDIRVKLVEDGQIVPEHMMVIEGLKKEDNMMMGRKEDRGKWSEGLDVKDLTVEKAEVVFHVGCHISYDESQWPVARNAVNLIKECGVDVGIMGGDEACCGCRAYDIGFRGELIRFAEHNIQAWKNAGVKTVVTSCADGYYAMKRLYPDYGSEFEVVHAVEFIGRLIGEGKLRFSKAVPLTVTYHDPCHMGRRLDVYEPGKPIMGLYDEPREIIKAIPGVEFIEMYRIKEYAWCCGAGGGVVEAYPDFAMFTAGERVEEALSIGAEVIVTCCPWCESNFREAIEEKGEGIKVFDILDLVQMAM
jgi:Fe-S oxidoreductase